MCLLYLRRKSKMMLNCEHALCENCLCTFDNSSKNSKCQYIIEECFFCSSESFNVVLHSFITRSRILSIDDENIRNVIFLNFFKLLQKIFKDDCKIQNLFDLTFKTSSNEWIQILKKKLTNVKRLIVLDMFIR